MIASLSLPALAATLAAAGFALGLAYFAALRRTTTALAGSGGWRTAAALTLGRLAAALVFLFLAAKLGAVALLAAFAGFLAARAAALRAVRGGPL